MESKLISLIAKILDIDPKRLDSNSGPGLISEWDSLANLSIITEIEEKFDVTLELDDILSFNTILDILKILKKHVTEDPVNSKISHNYISDKVIKGLRQSTNLFTDINLLKDIKEVLDGEILVVLGSEKYSSSIKEHIKLLLNENNHNIIFAHKESGEPNKIILDNIFSQVKKTPDIIIGIGGGSVIDTCKFILIKSNNPSLSLQKLSLNSNVHDFKTSTKLISVPTTYGSGAEVSSAAVFNGLNGTKNIILSHDFISETVIHDPIFCRDLPYSKAIDSVIDAMTHSLEGYMSKIYNKKL